MTDAESDQIEFEKFLPKVIDHLLKDNPGGFSVAPDGTLVADRQATEIKSIEQFSELARAPKTITFDLTGGKIIKFKIRPLDCDEYREIDKLDSELPQPPKKEQSKSPSIAKSQQRNSPLDDYDWDNPDYKKKVREHRELKRAAVIVKGLLNLAVPGENLETQRDHLHKNFPPRILDGIEATIRSITSDPIERALFS